jgi:hypothetical protein
LLGITALLVASQAEASRTILVRTLPITSSQVVPPSGSGAAGSANVRIDPAAHTLSIEITHNVSNQASAHLHGPAVRGVNAGIKFTLPLGSPAFGSFNFAASDCQNIVNGRFYVDVHSASFPNGEIRGQIDSLVTKIQPDYDRIVLSSDITISKGNNSQNWRVAGKGYFFRTDSSITHNLATDVVIDVNGSVRAIVPGPGAADDNCFGLCPGSPGCGHGGLFCGCPMVEYNETALRDCAEMFPFETDIGALHPADIVHVHAVARSGSAPEILTTNDIATFVFPAATVVGLGAPGLIALALILLVFATMWFSRRRMRASV